MVDIKAEDEITSEEAKIMIQKAKDDVSALLQKTNTEIAARVQEAKEAAIQKGYEKAHELKDKLDKLQTLVLNEIKEGILHTAVAVAKDVLKATVAASPDTVLSVTKNALGKIPDSANIWLRVHPADAAILMQNKQKLIAILERVKDIDIREDRQVERGGVLIQTESGVIDAQIKTQIEEMARILGV